MSDRASNARHPSSTRLGPCPLARRALAEWSLRTDEGYTIRVANDRGTRERAYALAAEVYRSRGYVAEDQTWVMDRFDTLSETFTLLAEDSEGRPAATVSIVFDSELGLPCEQLYAGETVALRSPDRRIGEVVRLAVAEGCRHEAALFTRMINLAFIYGWHVRHATDCLIEVTPRHAKFYERLLGFQQLGDARPNPRVSGTVGVLLHLKMTTYVMETARDRRKNRRENRKLYRNFLPSDQEGDVALMLARRHRAMDSEQARHFGLEMVGAAEDRVPIAASA